MQACDSNSNAEPAPAFLQIVLHKLLAQGALKVQLNARGSGGHAVVRSLYKFGFVRSRQSARKRSMGKPRAGMVE